MVVGEMRGSCNVGSMEEDGILDGGGFS